MKVYISDDTDSGKMVDSLLKVKKELKDNSIQHLYLKRPDCPYIEIEFKLIQVERRYNFERDEPYIEESQNFIKPGLYILMMVAGICAGCYWIFR